MKTAVGRAAIFCTLGAAACLGGAGAAEIADGVTLSGDLRVRNESLFRNDAFSAAGDERAFELFAGRMPNPYVRSMILWDSDFNPDGLAEKLVLKGTSADLFLNAGQHVLGQESATDKNYGPTVYGIQPGLRLKRDSGTLAVAAAYYAFIEAGGIDDVPAGGDYAVADVHACWKAKTAGGRPWGLWADGLVNTEADDHRTAYGVGVDLGSTKGKGAARLRLSYMSIDRNALWIDLGDANFSSGLRDEDMHGFVLGAAVGIGEKATLGATWYYKDSRDTDAHEDQLEIDLVLKF